MAYSINFELEYGHTKTKGEFGLKYKTKNSLILLQKDSIQKM